MTWKIPNVIRILEKSILRYVIKETNYKIYQFLYDIYVLVFLFYK